MIQRCRSFVPVSASLVGLVVLVTWIPLHAVAVNNGFDQVQVSFTGPSGDYLYNALNANAAFDPDRNQVLVVWSGCHDDHPYHYEVFGQQLDAKSGDLVGDRIQISYNDIGGVDRIAVSVVFNPAQDEYLVVWIRDVETDGEWDVFGQRIAAATGELVGGPTRISNMAMSGGVGIYINEVAVAFNSTEDEYFVVWEGVENSPPSLPADFEIYGRRLDAVTSQPVGEMIRISFTGPDGDVSFFSESPDLALNSVANEYLVVWSGNGGPGGVPLDGAEAFVRRIDGATGALLGAQTQISESFLGGEDDVINRQPAVGFNPIDEQYLAVWYNGPWYHSTGYDTTVLGQRLDASGLEIGDNDFVIAKMERFPFTFGYEQDEVDVAHDGDGDSYMVVYTSNRSPGLAVREYEIMAQRVDGATGTIVGGRGYRVSHVGPDGDPRYQGLGPAVVANSVTGGGIVAFMGGEQYYAPSNGRGSRDFHVWEVEIWAAGLPGSEVFIDGFESGDTSAWSAAVW